MTRNITTFLIILTVLLSSSCKQTRKQAFDKFVFQLDNIKLPYIYDSENPKTNTKKIDEGDSSFFVQGPTIHDYIGYFNDDSNCVHILSVHSGDFFQDLCISTFDKEGNLLNRISPSFDNCVGQIPIEFKNCKETITINKDKRISCSSIKVFIGSNQQDSFVRQVRLFKLLTDGRLSEE